jgi:hypothetical protein
VRIEKVIFGKKEGDLFETLLLSHAERYNIADAIAHMESDGWQEIRVADIDLNIKPDFIGTINK